MLSGGKYDALPPLFCYGGGDDDFRVWHKSRYRQTASPCELWILGVCLVMGGDA